jgi:hypothetical protein
MHVAENDNLNVRADPNYQSRKVGALPDGAYVGIDRCRKSGRSVWCRVHHMAQNDYESFGYDAESGWVNARYLSPSSRGYVLIDGKANCYYVLGCQNGMCDLVESYRQDKDYHIISLKTRKIRRSRLYGESNFGAANPQEEGYCVNHRYIEDYFQSKKLNAQKKRL